MSPACTPSSVSAAWDGPNMFIAWMMDAFSRKFYTDNCQQESGKSGAPPCGSWTLAKVTSKRVKLSQTSEKMLRVNVPPGDGQWKKESRKQTRNFARKLKEAPSPPKQLYFALLQLHVRHVLHSRIGLLDRHSKISVERSLGTLWSLQNVVFFIAFTLHLDEFFN